MMVILTYNGGGGCANDDLEGALIAAKTMRMLTAAAVKTMIDPRMCECVWRRRRQ